MRKGADYRLRIGLNNHSEHIKRNQRGSLPIRVIYAIGGSCLLLFFAIRPGHRASRSSLQSQR
jgi:hypothetical protein